MPHIESMSDPQTYDAYDTSLPADHPFVTRAYQFQYHLSPLEHAKSDEIMNPQPWCEAEIASLNMGYFPLISLLGTAASQRSQTPKAHAAVIAAAS
ncbi:hypothetical protein N7513_012465 [Penicillium frequentans]|nr:hypothetical protein N7513_012465 [Penicillium glabrum]